MRRGWARLGLARPGWAGSGAARRGEGFRYGQNDKASKRIHGFTMHAKSMSQ